MTRRGLRGVSDAPTEAFDERAVRDVLGHFVTGIAVVTARGPDDEHLGMTVNSFNSVSLEPPLILFSVDRRSQSFDSWVATDGFAVNILNRSQSHLSNRFAQSSRSKWDAVRYTPGMVGARLLDGALAHIECRPHARYDGGDHVIFVGEVVQFRFDAEGEPLVYFRGRYNSLGKDESAPEWPLPMHYF